MEGGGALGETWKCMFRATDIDELSGGNVKTGRHWNGSVQRRTGVGRQCGVSTESMQEYNVLPGLTLSLLN